MIPTLVGLSLAAFLLIKANTAIEQERSIIALVYCFLSSTAFVEFSKLDSDFFRSVMRALSAH